MAKSKSSASSGTRKKYARKAAASTGEERPVDVPKDKKQKKDKKGKEPRKKVYIPPVKPAPVQPNPLDTLGLAQTLPPELLVVLRRLSKKDAITKRRALEEFQTGWLDKARTEGQDSEVLVVLAETIPVWLHHLPALFLHPSRRIRLLAAGVHSSLLRLSNAIRDQISFFLREAASEDQVQFILGTWCLAAHDADRQVSFLARESWHSFISLSESSGKLSLAGSTLSSLWEFIQNTLFDPAGIYSYVNPPQPAAPPPPPHKKGTKAPPKKEEESSRAKVEEEEESVQDRMARLRIGAFGAAEWVLNARSTQQDGVSEESLAPFANPVLWSALHPLKTPPLVEAESAGCNQPVVRRAAWALLQTLLRTSKDRLQSLLSILSTAVLRSAWIETDQLVRGAMWQPLLTFLKAFPTSWELETRVDKADEESDAESEVSEDEAHDGTEKPRCAAEPSSGPSKAYQEFLQFLQLGCGGSPVQGYPAILIILSTIPSSVLGSSPSPCPLDDLFVSFWAAVDARALSSLDRAAASAAFLASILECTVFMVRRILNSTPEQASVLATGKSGADRAVCKEAAEKLCGEQFKRVWEELSTGRLKIEGSIAASIIAKNMAALYQLDEELFHSAWDSLTSETRQQAVDANAMSSSLLSVLLKAFLKQFEDNSVPGTLAKELVCNVVRSAVQGCDQLLSSSAEPSGEELASIVNTLEVFGDTLFEDLELSQGIDDAVKRHTYRLLTSAPAVLQVYFTRRADQSLSSSAWQDVLAEVVSHSGDVHVLLPPLLDAAEKGALPDYLRPQGQLDDLAGGLLAEALGTREESAEYALISKLLACPDRFISTSCAQGLADSICSSITLHFDHVLHDTPVSFDAFNVALRLVELVAEKQGVESLSADSAVPLFADIFMFGYLVPQYHSLEPGQLSLTRSLWNLWLEGTADDLKKHTSTLIRQRLRELIADCAAQPTPQQILQMVSEGCPGVEIDVLLDLFPPREALDDILDGLPSAPTDPSLAVLDPLIPPATQCDYDTFSVDAVDAAGYSAYARICTGLLSHLLDDRHAARENVWALHHLLAVSIYADDLLKVPYAESPVFSSRVSRIALQELIRRVQQLAAYLLSLRAESENWHKDVGLSVVSNSGTILDKAGQLVKELITRARKSDPVREARILSIVLQHVLGDATKDDSEHWLNSAQKLERQAPHTSLAIVTAVTRYAPEPPSLDRLRNRLAADMVGVRASKANTEGLWLLRRLTAVAPDTESDVVFLPQPRAVNLMKACQQWITSDDELDEEVDSEMTSVFFHLAPILQNVPGGHWDLFFDLMENNLENASLAETDSLVALSRSLKLFIAIEDLASTNRALRALWEERRTNCLTFIRDIVAVKPDAKKASEPLSACRELGLQIVQDLPASLMDVSTLGKFCYILTDLSIDVQRMGYQLLHGAATKYTENIVIEAAVDSDAAIKPQLPAELLDLLQYRLNLDEILENDDQEVSGYLLAWMLVFDLFSNASLKVKAGYTEQVKDLELVGSFFLPNVFNILGIYGGLARTFKLDPWAVDEYYLDSYSTGSSLSLRLLAAHLYYRALLVVPSLVRNWLADCRDLQLLRSVTTYTANNFSPAIIKAELSQVKDTASAAELKDENLTIKVANAVSEVTAVYTVDEHQLEMTVKLPSDYPLHGIEIKDTKRFGVPEDRWRAWVLGVQQILSYRSGSIVDGLSFFKKNVTSHFEGLAECAICYSIISAMDGTLPRKPCKTCKNRFHAGCLYKWFNSSHSSSCPLCRSEMV